MDKYITKTSYYVEYLGWKPVKGLQGRLYTEPIVRELIQRKKRDNPPKITLQLNKKELKVSRETVDDGKKRKIKCIKYPPIPTRDITFAIQGLEPDCEVVASVFLGYNPKTRRYVHAHVYRFDSASTASQFVHYIQTLASVPDNVKRIRKIENDLIQKGHIEKPDPKNDHKKHVPLHADGSSDSFEYNSGNSVGSDGSPPRDIEDDLVSLHEVTPFDSITDELKQRLVLGGAPLLLPPKDYDTVSRAKGNTSEASRRKCLNTDIIGSGATHRDFKENNKTTEETSKESTSVTQLISKYNQKPKADTNNNKKLQASAVMPGSNITYNTAAASSLPISSNEFDNTCISESPNICLQPGPPRVNVNMLPDLITSVDDNRSESPQPIKSQGLSRMESLNNFSLHSQPYTSEQHHFLTDIESHVSNQQMSTSSGNSTHSCGSGSKTEFKFSGNTDIPSITVTNNEYATQVLNLEIAQPITNFNQNFVVNSPLRRNHSLNRERNTSPYSQEPIADYDLDEPVRRRVPSLENNLNAVSQMTASDNIFTHDFYRKTVENQTKDANFYFLHPQLKQQRSNPVQRVHSFR